MRQGRISDRTNQFEWRGGHPALDLVNTLDERPSDAPIDNLASYRDLTRFAELRGLSIVGPPHVCRSSMAAPAHIL